MVRFHRPLTFAVLATALGLAWPVPASFAKSQALLIGVSEYTGSAKNILSNLSGPGNDVTQIWRYLKANGFTDQDIAVLANGIKKKDAAFPKPTGKPDYKTIKRELEKLATAKYQKGDMVVFFYSGHGTTEPDDDPSKEQDPEPNGRDQVLLPSDVGMFHDTTKRIENGLVDDELGLYLTRIRNQGATVWVIIDACNSGSATRGGDVSRAVDPEKLGVPKGALPPVETRGADRKGPLDGLPAAGAGNLIGFYAVDAYNLALERDFDFAKYQQPSIPDNKRMGVFTHFLIQALNLGQAQNYRELFQDVIAAMAMDETNSTVARPIADGNLDLGVLGRSQSGVAAVKGLLEGDALTIQAGSLQGFAKDAVVTLFASGKDGKPLATATVTSASAVTSKASDIEWLKDVTPEKAGAFPVQVTRPAVSLAFAVALPDTKSKEADKTAPKVARLLDEAFKSADAQKQYGVRLVDANSPGANLVVKVEGGKIWLVKPGEPLVMQDKAFGETFNITPGSDDKETLAALRDSIWRLARAEKLLKAAEVVAQSDSAQSDLKFAVSRFRSGKQSTSGREACTRTKPLSAEESKSLTDVTQRTDVGAGNCDIFQMSLANLSSDRSYYAAAFYVDARGGVTALKSATPGANLEGCGYALPKRSSGPFAFDFQVATWDATAGEPSTIGNEHVVVLAVEQDANRAMPPFCNLSQESLPKSMKFRGEESVIQTLFDGITGGTRGLGATLASPEGLRSSAFRFDFTVAP